MLGRKLVEKLVARLRGQRPTTPADSRVEEDNHDLRFAGVLWPRRIAEFKFLFMGASGTGKTLSIRLLFQSALLGFVKGSRRKALVYDPNGNWPGLIAGMTTKWATKPTVKKLNPFDRDGYAYDFAADFQNTRVPASAAANFAMTLIPDGQIGGNDNAKFFTSSAQRWLAMLVESLHDRVPGNWTLWHVVTAALDPRLTMLVIERSPRGRSLLDSFKMSESTLANVLQTVASFLWELEPAALGWHDRWTKSEEFRFTFDHWFASEDIVILRGNSEHPRSVEPINTLVLEFLRQRLKARPDVQWHKGDVPETWMFLDEFQNLTPLPEVVDFFTETRSKGGVQVVGLQEVDQLIEKYGRERAGTILGQLRHVGIFKLENPTSRRYFEERIGTREEIITVRSSSSTTTSNYDRRGMRSGHSTATSSSTNEQFVTRPTVLAQQFGELEQVTDDTCEIDAWYIANGSVERHQYSALECGLTGAPPGFDNDPLPDPANLKPRGWLRSDFGHLGFSEKDIPSDYLASSRPKPLSLDEHATEVKKWRLPGYDSTS